MENIMHARNDKWSIDRLFAERKKVLSEWATGKELQDLEEAILFNKDQLVRTPAKNLRERILQAKAEKKVLFLAMISRPTSEETLEAMRFIEEDVKPEVWTVIGDTYTRKGLWRLAQKRLEERAKGAKISLNGWPFVNSGVKSVRHVTESVDAPLKVVTNEEGQRLQAEMAFAGGIRGFVSSDLSDLVEHCKDMPLSQRIESNQYCCRLGGYYEERGVPITAQVAAHACGWNTPGFKVTLVLLTALQAAAQGIKDIILSQSQFMNLVQDIAAIRSARNLVEEYFSRFGYSDVTISTCSVPWIGAWPEEVPRADALIAWNTIIGILGGAELIKLKCPDEALRIPTKEGFRAALKTGKQLALIMGRQRLPESEELSIEEEIIKLEVRSVVDRVLEMGDGDPVRGEIRAVELGIIDGAFSSWRHLKQKVLPGVDHTGAIRYLDHGNIPLPKEVLEYHREKLEERQKVFKEKSDVETLCQDLVRVVRPL